MDSILDGDLADEIANALDGAGIPYAVTVIRDVPVDSPDPADPQPPVATPYQCKGFLDDWDAAFLASGLVQRTDAKIVVVANTISITPVAGDRVTVRGKSYSIVTVTTDPAGATFTLQARA